MIYWTRLGDYLPDTDRDQRVDRLKTSMKGIIADGLLARFSVTGADPSASFAILAEFIPALLLAVAPARRAAFVGTSLAQAMPKA